MHTAWVIKGFHPTTHTHTHTNCVGDQYFVDGMVQMEFIRIHIHGRVFAQAGLRECGRRSIAITAIAPAKGGGVSDAPSPLFPSTAPHHMVICIWCLCVVSQLPHPSQQSQPCSACRLGSAPQCFASIAAFLFVIRGDLHTLRPSGSSGEFGKGSLFQRIRTRANQLDWMLRPPPKDRFAKDGWGIFHHAAAQRQRTDVCSAQSIRDGFEAVCPVFLRHARRRRCCRLENLPCEFATTHDDALWIKPSLAMSLLAWKLHGNHPVMFGSGLDGSGHDG